MSRISYLLFFVCLLCTTSCHRLDKTVNIFCSFFYTTTYPGVDDDQIDRLDTIYSFPDEVGHVVRVDYHEGLTSRHEFYYVDQRSHAALIYEPVIHHHRMEKPLADNGYPSLRDPARKVYDDGIVRLHWANYFIIIVFCAIFCIRILVMFIS